MIISLSLSRSYHWWPSRAVGHFTLQDHIITTFWWDVMPAWHCKLQDFQITKHLFTWYEIDTLFRYNQQKQKLLHYHICWRSHWLHLKHPTHVDCCWFFYLHVWCEYFYHTWYKMRKVSMCVLLDTQNVLHLCRSNWLKYMIFQYATLCPLRLWS